MKTIYITCSALAKYTGHNTYEPLERVVEELLIKNNLQVGSLPKSTIERGLRDLSDETLSQLKTELNLSESTSLGDITKVVKSIVKPSLTTKTEQQSHEAIAKTIANVESDVLKTLVPSIQQDVRMIRGCKQEQSDIDAIQTAREIVVTERNSKMYCGELYRCKEYVVMLRGKVDGVSNDTIIESKHRTKRLFKVLRSYEQVQLESYMFLTGLSNALLTEHYNDTHHCIEYSHDEEFWKECIQNTVQFMDTHVRPLLTE